MIDSMIIIIITIIEEGVEVDIKIIIEEDIRIMKEMIKMDIIVTEVDVEGEEVEVGEEVEEMEGEDTRSM